MGSSFDTQLKTSYFVVKYLAEMIALILEIFTAMNLVNQTKFDFDCLSALNSLELYLWFNYPLWSCTIESDVSIAGVKARQN